MGKSLHCVGESAEGAAMSKIVIVDTDFEDNSFERELADAAGVELVCCQGREPDQVIVNAADADGIVTSYAKFPRRVFEALPQLKVVSRTGVGFDTIDLEAATEHGVAVCTAPGYGTEVVSDHAITLALCVLRRINEIDADMRNGLWNYKVHRPLGQVHGRTFGVVGMGEIGRAVARKAAGLGFHVICSSRSLKPGRRTPEGYDVFELDGLLAAADVVSFHCALTPETHHLLDARRIALMKPDAVVVNTSRGAVVDTDAMAEALCEGRLWGAGLDVFEGEPVDFQSAICKAPHTVLTSHAAYWSEESGRELRTRSMQSAIDVVLGRRPADCLNPCVFSDAALPVR